MINEITRYVALKRVVALALDEMNSSAGSFDKAWILGFRAIIDCYTNIQAETKTVRLPVEANLTVAYPADLLQWVKIGVLNGNNEVSTLKINRSLTKFKDQSPDRLSALTPDVASSNLTVPFDSYYLNYWNGGLPIHLFGVGGGMITPGECTVDDTNRVIILGPDFAYPHIMLEYKSSPEKDEDYRVDLFCQEAVIAFIKWKLKQGSEQEYYNRVKEARRKIKPITIQEINQVLREGMSFKLKA